MPNLTFQLPDGQETTVAVDTLLNAGYAGRSQADVAAHVAELAELGVPAPTRVPCIYPIAPYLATQTDEVPVQHDRTSGEAEWALIVAGNDPDDLLITAACDHTDRRLEQHGVAWSKQAAPDVLARKAWRLSQVESYLDELTLVGTVTTEDGPREIQRGTLAELLTPMYWAEELAKIGLFNPGTVLMSGTIPMDPEVDQFSTGWHVELGNPHTGDTIALSYAVRRIPPPLD